MEYGKSKIDLHMHSTSSDGTDTPQEILDKVREAKLSLFSVTDHDAMRAASIIPSLLREGDSAFVTGIEFSCKDDFGKYHILGYGFDPDSESMMGIVGRSHSMRMKKLQRRLDFLRETYGFTFSEEDEEKLLALENPGKPHLGNLMVKYGYAKSKSDAITKYINVMKTKSIHVHPEDAIKSILAGGGIPVLAHGFFGSGDEDVSYEELVGRIERLMDFGLQGIEAFYSSFTDEMIKKALAIAEKNNLYVTSGSDYHGTNKPVLLADTGLSPDMNYPKGLLSFIERVTK